MRAARLGFESDSERPGDASAPAQNSMRILDQPLNGNIAISQFQLLEWLVAAIQGLMSRRYLEKRGVLVALRLMVIKPDHASSCPDQCDAT